MFQIIKLLIFEIPRLPYGFEEKKGSKRFWNTSYCRCENSYWIVRIPEVVWLILKYICIWKCLNEMRADCIDYSEKSLWCYVLCCVVRRLIASCSMYAMRTNTNMVLLCMLHAAGSKLCVHFIYIIQPCKAKLTILTTMQQHAYLFIENWEKKIKKKITNRVFQTSKFPR